MKPHEYIATNYNDLADGESRKGCTGEGCYRMDNDGDCPSKCDLEVTRDGKLLIFNCLSDSCGCKKSNHGRAGCVALEGRGSLQKSDMVSGGRDKSIEKRIKKSSPIPRDVVQTLPRHVVKYLADNNVSERDGMLFGFVWSGEHSKLVFPLAYDGQETGCIYRVLREQPCQSGLREGNYLKATKWLRSFSTLSLPFLRGEGTTLYLVESVMSGAAITSNLKLPTLSLLGVMLDEDKLSIIKKTFKRHGFKELVFIPDPDISNINALKVRRRLTLSVGKCSILRTKNKPRHSLEEIKGKL